MSYSGAIAEIDRRRMALTWTKAELARRASLSIVSTRHFLAGRWPDNEYRAFMRRAMEEALRIGEAQKSFADAAGVEVRA